MATVRWSRVSRARYTSPVPPAPSGDWISYGPSFVPVVSPMRAELYATGWDNEFAALSDYAHCRTFKSLIG